MPPHCDTRDGPVVKAARKALETGNVNLILIWVPETAERELRDAFERTLKARKAGTDAKDVADDWFFETAVRLHRAGEGAPYTGLKPAGLDTGPVVPRAEKAIETGNASDTVTFILHTIEEDLKHRFNHVMLKKEHNENDVKAGREFIQAYIGFVVYSHHLYAYVKGGGEHPGEKSGGHEH